MGGLALQLRAIAARAPMPDRPAIVAAADAVEENARLRHDIDRHVGIAADLATENEKLRAERDAALLDANVLREINRTLEQSLAEARALATCGCGDEFTTHDPGTCGACMAQNDSGLRIALQKAEAERDAWAAWVVRNRRRWPAAWSKSRCRHRRRAAGGQAMTPQTARCYIAALAIQARIEGMKAENQFREHRGEQVAHAGDAFFYEAGELERLSIEVINQ